MSGARFVWLLALAWVALAALGLRTRSVVYADGATLGTPDVSCARGTDGAKARFAWTPAAGASQQWLDVSLSSTGFADGSFVSAGPLDGAASAYDWSGLKNEAAHFWRVNALTPAGWTSSVTATFSTCAAPVAANATDTASGVSFTFGDDVGDSDRQTIQDAVVYARQQGLASLGLSVTSLSVYAYGSLDGIAGAMAGSDNEPSRLLEFKNLLRTSGVLAVAYNGAMFVNAGNANWQISAGGDIYHVVAHEYFHLVQDSLLQKQEAGPDWLLEGSAEAFGYGVYAQKTGVELAAIRSTKAGLVKGYDVTLDNLESRSQFESSSDRSYPLGFLAVDSLTHAQGLAQVISYYKAVGEGTSWHDAFARSFGTTVEHFYDQFEAYRTSGFKTGP